jgi:hypothetical protein
LKFIKEKEMPEFRKWILALAGVGLFAGFASAQVGTPTSPPTTGTAPTCTTTNGAVTPTVRADGYTELAGDIVIVCSGGTPLALGSPVPTANITIFMNTAVTSRLLTGSGGASEALLLIDEPGSGLMGVGPSLPQLPCPLASAAFGAGPGGCTMMVGTSTAGGGTAGVAVSTGCASATTPCATTYNMFSGTVSGNSVTFFGVPVLAPATSGLTRVLRITNIRTNANQITAGGPTPGSLVASISTNSASSLPIASATLTVGFVVQGLNATNTTTRNAGNTGAGGGSFNQCTSVSVTSTSSTATAGTGGLQFQENFATAFKTRFQNTSIGNSGSVGSVIQNVPGTIYNSESGFQALSLTSSSSAGSIGTTYIAGVADYGTRLKATFTNVPSGVSLYVSTRDVQNNFFIGSNAQYSGFPQAQLVVSETAVDTGTPGGANSVPLVTQTAAYAGPTFGGASTSAPGIAPVLLNSGTGTAVWEIVNTNPSTIDTVNFAVYINYTANPASNIPSAPSTMNVTLSFAPTPASGAFTATAGAAASNVLTVPRFSDSYDITATLAKFVLCTTDLLYPYVINTNGFDTGLAIANTSTDPFGTTAQVGTCQLNFYGSTAPSGPFTTPSIATGTVYANLASTLAPGFSGYIIAVCNFQYAHGFAFVSDVGARNLAMGYLALVFNSGTALTRGSSAENLNN